MTKTDMKYILVVAFTNWAGFAFAQSGEKNFIDQNYVEVTGKAEMQVVPDLIYLKIKISEKDSKNKVSVAAMEKMMTDKFQELGIDVKKDLSVNDFLSFFKNKMLAKADVILAKEYQLVVHDARTAGRVINELEKLDISNVSVDHLDHTKIEDLRKEVKMNAVKAAKDKAEYLTKSIGQNIGRAIFISELDNNFSPSNSISVRGYSYSYSEPKLAIDLDFEKIKLEYSILVRFELK